MERLTMAVIDRDGKELFKDESRNAEIMREAVKGGSVRLVELLLENRVPLQKKGDQYGWTPIHYAARQGQVAMVEFLIHSGVDVNARNPLGESAYNIAESTRNKELQDLIVKLKGKTDPRRLPTGPYLGQKPPGMTPKVFAPGIVSTADHEFSTSFSPDGKELYFSRRHPDLGQNVVMFSRVVDGAWTSPEVAPFAGTQMSFEPFVTPDNQRLFFQAGRVVDGGLHMFTLYVERTGEAWGEVKDPGEPFNPDRTMHVSATSDGTIYTTDISGGMMARTAQGQSGPGNECLGVVRLSNGRYEKLEKLGPPLNAIKQSQHPWVSPDESLMIFSAPKSGYPSSSALFVTRRSPDGSWSVPREVDLGISAGQPFVTPDGRYLFFSSGGRGTGKGDLYWVSARILDRTR